MHHTSNLFGATGTFQTYEVPATGRYLIEAAGARRGAGRILSKGVFLLRRGDVLKIVVGRCARAGRRQSPAAVGETGCSFVWKRGVGLGLGDGTMLVATGGGAAHAAGPTALLGFHDDGYVTIAPVTATVQPPAPGTCVHSDQEQPSFA